MAGARGHGEAGDIGICTNLHTCTCVYVRLWDISWITVGVQ